MNEDSIFLEALQQGSATARAAFLDQACAGNAELRDGIERLLRAHEKADEILHAKAPGLPVTATTSVSERPGLQPLQAAEADRRGRLWCRLHGRAAAAGAATRGAEGHQAGDGFAAGDCPLRARGAADTSNLMAVAAHG